MQNYYFTPTDKKIRWGWLALHSVNLLIILGIFVATTITLLSTHTLDSVKVVVIAYSGLQAIASVALFGFLYYCAYKKPGTLLVTLSAFWFFGKCILSLATLVFTFQFSRGLVLLEIFFCLFYILHIAFALSMRKLNHKILQHELQSTPVYLKALEFLLTATNLSDLNSKVRELLLKTENAQADRSAAIYSAYENCKTKFVSA